MKIISASDSSVLVVFGDAITPEIRAQVLKLLRALRKRDDKRIRNVHPGYASVLVDFDPLSATHEEVSAIVQGAMIDETEAEVGTGMVVKIPVCYGEEYGPDLTDAAVHTKINPDEIIRLHSGAIYDVCFLGFTAGFAYLSGMPEELSMPRLATPRRLVAAGSVGIAGAQTGIYPTETPGGWRLIGRTPLRMFDSKRSQPTLVLPGYQVRFTSISRGEFARLSQGTA